MHIRTGSWRLGLLALSVCSCTSTSEPPPAGEEGPTYATDIAPLVGEHCVGCHTSGGIAPFPLDTYEALAAYGPIARVSIEARTMPPYAVDSSGECGTYADARWLRDDEIATFGKWVDAGMIRGTETAAPPKTVSSALDGPTVDIEMSAAYQPDYSGGHDDYRCFLVDVDITSDRFLTGFQIVPGNPAIVHHLLLFSVLSEQAERDAERLEAEDPELGYDCFGTGRVASIPIAAWAPGLDTVQFPEGTGLRVLAGRKLIMQIHYYRGSGTTDPDRTKVVAELATSVAKEAFLFGSGYPGRFELPPGQPEVVLEGDIPLQIMTGLGIDDADLLGVFPHMHSRGRRMSLTAVDSGVETCLSDVPRYDFHWQQFYFFENAPKLSPSQIMRTQCVFDTSMETAPITSGENTDDEMCLFGFYMTAQGFDFETYARFAGQLGGGGEPPPPPTGESEELTFLAMNELSVARFGANPQLPVLLSSQGGGGGDGGANRGAFLFSVRGADETSTFPLSGMMYGGQATIDPESGLYRYTSSRDFAEIAVGGNGAFDTPPQTLSMALGPVPLTLSGATLSGTMQGSGAITGIADLEIDGCLSEADLETIIQSVGQAGQILRNLAEADCDLDGDGTFDALRVTIVSQPIVVPLDL
jgi:hypothetical protein